MMLTLDDVPVKTPIGMQYTLSPKKFPDIEISSLLRRLLIIVDGRRSVQDLLNSGLSGADIHSVQLLLLHGLIAPRDVRPVSAPQVTAKVATANTASQPAAAAPPIIKRSFSSVRFDVLDLLLNLSMQDFSVRQWVARFEQVKNHDELWQLAQQFCGSEFALKHQVAVSQLKALLS